MSRRSISIVATALALLVSLGILINTDAGEPDWIGPADEPDTVETRERGGSVAVGVSTPPEYADRGTGGDTLRQLTLPSLFVAQPDGKWAASLADPGSDRTARDARSAWFRLNDARWSDGAPITVDDLRRTADNRYVSEVTQEGNRVRVEFNAPFPGWRGLWSVIEPPRPELTAGPFRVAKVESGLETVLARNDDWFGSGKVESPFLDEIRLRVVPDPITARRMIATGTLDVWAPKAQPARTENFEALEGVTLAQSDTGGRWTALQFNNARVPDDVRKALAAGFQRDAFVKGVMSGEARSWSGPGGGVDLPDDVPAVTDRMTATLSPEEPTANLLDKALTRTGSEHSVQVDLSSRSEAAIDPLVESGDYDMAFVSGPTLPQDCWSCVYGYFDVATARAADAGDAKAQERLESRIGERSLMVPLWQENTVVAYRSDRLRGVEANGYGPGVAYGAETWWQP